MLERAGPTSPHRFSRIGRAPALGLKCRKRIEPVLMALPNHASDVDVVSGNLNQSGRPHPTVATFNRGDKQPKANPLPGSVYALS